MDGLHYLRESLARARPPPKRREGPSEGILKTIMGLRGLSISEESTFDFEGPEDWRQWPSVRYGRDSPHLHYANATKGCSNKHQSTPTKPARPSKTRKPKAASSAKKKKVEEPSKQHGPIPSRDPPLHLLALPRELRDIIYSLLCVSDASLYPQLRPVWRNGGKRRLSDIRRYPLEPCLSRVSRQLRDEVLSLFYDKNCFVFKSSDVSALSYYNMASPAMQARWISARPASDDLRQIELRVKARGLYLDICVTFKIKRLHCGRVTITYSSDDSSCCSWLEDVVTAETLVEAKGDGNLMRVLHILCTKRTAKWATIAELDEDGMFQMAAGKCEYCLKAMLTHVSG